MIIFNLTSLYTEIKSRQFTYRLISCQVALKNGEVASIKFFYNFIPAHILVLFLVKSFTFFLANFFTLRKFFMKPIAFPIQTIQFALAAAN